MNRKLKVITGILSLILIVGCSNNEANNNALVEQPKQVEQETNTNEPTNEDKEGVVTEEPPADEEIETDPAVMADFQALVDGKAAAADLKIFLDSQIGKVATEDFTQMVLAFEDSQQAQLLALEDRFYNGTNFQEELWELYKDGFESVKVDSITNPELKKLIKETQAGGYKVETTEGAYFPIINYEVYVSYQAHVNEDIRDYIEIKAIESRVISLKDASLIVGWDEAVKRALRQEAFITNHPSSPRIDEIKRLFGGYVYVTFNGVDNTPLFRYEDDTFDPEAKTAFTNAVKAGTESSPYLQRLGVLLDLIEKSDNKMSEEVTSYQQETTELWTNTTS